MGRRNWACTIYGTGSGIFSRRALQQEMVCTRVSTGCLAPCRQPRGEKSLSAWADVVLEALEGARAYRRSSGLSALCNLFFEALLKFANARQTGWQRSPEK